MMFSGVDNCMYVFFRSTISVFSSQFFFRAHIEVEGHHLENDVLYYDGGSELYFDNCKVWAVMPSMWCATHVIYVRRGLLNAIRSLPCGSDGLASGFLLLRRLPPHYFLSFSIVPHFLGVITCSRIHIKRHYLGAGGCIRKHADTQNNFFDNREVIGVRDSQWGPLVRVRDGQIIPHLEHFQPDDDGIIRGYFILAPYTADELKVLRTHRRCS